MVSDGIRDLLPSLGSAERRVALVLLGGSATVGLDSVMVLAARAGVSSATVLRCIGRLGFPNYSSFQHAWKEELDRRLMSPAALYAERLAANSLTVAESHGRGLAELVARTIDELPMSEFMKVAELLVDGRNSVLTFGGVLSRALSYQLAVYLGQLRRGVRELRPRSALELRMLGDEAQAKDVLVVFDFRRYEPQALQLAREFKRRRAKVVLITDKWISRVASASDHILTAFSESPSPFDSFVGAVALVETMVLVCAGLIGEDAQSRLIEFSSYMNGNEGIGGYLGEVDDAD